MGYSKNALVLRELPRVTQINSTDLCLFETTTGSVAATFADLIRNSSSIFYGFYINTEGNLIVDVISAAGEYDATIYKEWFLGSAGLTFTIDVDGNLVLDI